MLDTQQDARGVDLHYAEALLRNNYSFTGPPREPRPPNCSDIRAHHWWGDFGQVVTPGYHDGSTIKGFELRNRSGSCRDCEAPPIELAFYRSHTTNTVEPIVMIVMPSQSHQTDCIMSHQESYFECTKSRNPDCVAVPHAPHANATTAALPVVAAIFVARRTKADTLALCQEGAKIRRP